MAGYPRGWPAGHPLFTRAGAALPSLVGFRSNLKCSPALLAGAGVPVLIAIVVPPAISCGPVLADTGGSRESEPARRGSTTGLGGDLFAACPATAARGSGYQGPQIPGSGVLWRCRGRDRRITRSRTAHWPVGPADRATRADTPCTAADHQAGTVWVRGAVEAGKRLPNHPSRADRDCVAPCRATSNSPASPPRRTGLLLLPIKIAPFARSFREPGCA